MTKEKLKGKQAWTHIDKSVWGPGPWVEEHDHVLWVDGGYVCLIRRSDMGSLCGYVGVPKEHSMYGLTDDANSHWPFFAQPHGGVTWCGELPGDAVEFLCTLAANGQPLDYAAYWYFGFDCAHAGDIVPGLQRYVRQFGLPPSDALSEVETIRAEAAIEGFVRGDTYKDIDFLLDEVAKLAATIREVERIAREIATHRRQELLEQYATPSERET